MVVLFRVLALLPMCVLHALGWLGGWLTFLASPAYRASFRGNAAQAGYAFRQVRAGVGHAGRLVTELPRVWYGPPVEVRWEGAGLVDAAHAAGHGVLFLTLHMGCFDAAAQAYALRFGKRSGGITVLYRMARKRWLQALLQESRTRHHIEAAPATLGGVRQLVRALRAGRAVGLLPDQVPPQGLGVWAPFFGREAYTATLAARLAALPRVTTLLARVERKSCGRGYVLFISALPTNLPKDPRAAASALNREMEGLVRACPHQYLWGYERYKEPRKP